METKAPPLTTQVDGSHYTSMSMQPVEFSMANRLDACAHSILKYVSRHRSKNGERDLSKANHFVLLREELLPVGYKAPEWLIPMALYCETNQMPAAETKVLMALERWVCDPYSGPHAWAEVSARLQELVTSEYGV